MKRHWNNKRHSKSPRSEIKRLEEAIRREADKVQKESLRQQLEHWIRTQNNHTH